MSRKGRIPICRTFAHALGVVLPGKFDLLLPCSNRRIVDAGREWEEESVAPEGRDSNLVIVASLAYRGSQWTLYKYDCLSSSGAQCSNRSFPGKNRGRDGGWPRKSPRGHRPTHIL